MSRKLKLIIASLSLVFASSASIAQSLNPLMQISIDIAGTLQNISDPSMSTLQRLQTVSHQKSAAEFVMRESIINGSADPNDLNNPKSPTSVAFKSIDALTVLSELQLDTATGKPTAESCGRARSTLLATSMKSAAAEDVTLTGIDRQVESLINLMCGQK